MAKIEQDFIEPTNSERGYNAGWNAYHDGLILKSNPYNPETEKELYEGYVDGWGSAQMEDNASDD